MNILEKLEPCPFCEEADLESHSNGDGNEWIGCNECGAEGPIARLSMGEAASGKWNTRPEASAIIKELAETGSKLRKVGDDKMATVREWAEACREWDAALSKVKPLSSGEVRK